MLHATGKNLGVKSETVTSRNGAFDPFVAVTIHLLEGVTVTELRVGSSFDPGMLAALEEGDLLDVECSLFKGKLYAEQIIQRVPASEVKEGRKAA